MSSHLQETVSQLFASLKNKKEALQKEYASRMAEVDKEIDAVSTTLRLLRLGALEAKVPDVISVLDPVMIAQLEGKSAREALIDLAKANDGIVRIVDAKRTLIAAGILKDTKNIWGAIHTTLTRSKEFEKVPGQAGTFRFTEGRANFPIGGLSLPGVLL